MLAQIVDAVRVVNGAVGLDLIVGAKAVLGDVEGLLVAVPVLVQRNAQAEGVNAPAPVAGRNVGVRHLTQLRVQIRLLAGQAAVVVAQRYEIDRTLFQSLLVAGVEVDMNVVLIVIAQGVTGVIAADHDVAVQIFHLVVAHIPVHILGAMADGIGQVGAEHHADFVGRVDLMGNLGGLGAGDHLIVDALILGLQQVVDLVAGNAQMVEALVDDEVDLVDQNPLMNLALVAFEQHLAVLHKEVNDLAAGPAVVFQGQIQRHLIVADRDQRLHAVGNDRVDEVIVELQALLVGRGIIPVGEDTGPVDGGTQAVHAGACQQLDVLLVGVVEVDAAAFGVELVVLLHGALDVCGVDLHVVALVRRDVILAAVDVCQAPALAALFPCALHLVGGQCAAPEEVFRHTVVFAHLFHFRFSLSEISPAP